MDKDIRLCWLLTKDLEYGAKPSDTNTEFYNKLLSSIKNNGILEPILVINLADKFLVKVGNSRLWCANELGIERMKCVVVTLERDFGNIQIPNGEIIDKENIQSHFSYPISWVERENYVALKCTHFHIGKEKIE